MVRAPRDGSTDCPVFLAATSAAIFRSAMLVMGSIVFAGVLLATSRRAAVRRVSAETPTPIIASS